MSCGCGHRASFHLGFDGVHDEQAGACGHTDEHRDEKRQDVLHSSWIVWGSPLIIADKSGSRPCCEQGRPPNLRRGDGPQTEAEAQYVQPFLDQRRQPQLSTGVQPEP